MSFEHLVEPKRVQLRNMEAAYLRAQEYLKSPKATEDRLAALAKIESLMVYTHVEEGKALWLLGKISQIVDDMRAPDKLVTDYESIKTSVNELVAKG